MMIYPVTHSHVHRKHDCVRKVFLQKLQRGKWKVKTRTIVFSLSDIRTCWCSWTTREREEENLRADTKIVIVIDFSFVLGSAVKKSRNTRAIRALESTEWTQTWKLRESIREAKKEKRSKCIIFLSSLDAAKTVLQPESVPSLVWLNLKEEKPFRWSFCWSSCFGA